MSDLVLDKSYQLGNRGKKVRLIQEWLCLNGINVRLDGDFGPATDFAVKQFQKKNGLVVDGVVGDITFNKLILPMTNALMKIPNNGKPLRKMVIEYGQQHFKQHPREIGGSNKGPWVRLYMKGNEGLSWPWCAGFVCYILNQARNSANVPSPITPSFSCDSLAASAKKNNIFLKESEISDKNIIKPGSFFLSRRTSMDWEHIGIVTLVENDIFYSIEGNTNDEGSAEGYEVCKRIRNYKGKDFILI
jgi:hypothetical protein